MRKLLHHNPRQAWRWMLGALVIWAGLAAVAVGWITSRPLPQKPAVTLKPSDTTVQQNQAERQPLGAYRAVWQRPLRQTLIEKKEKDEPEKPQKQRDPFKARLVGTVVEGPRSYAVFRKPGGKLAVIEVGERIEGHRLVQVEPARVALSRDGMRRQLRLPQELRQLLPERVQAEQGDAVSLRGTAHHDRASTSRTAASRIPGKKAEQSPTATVGPGSGNTEKRDAKQKPQKLRLSAAGSKAFLEEVRLTPARGADGHEGVRIDSLSAGGAVARSGLQSGDLIAAIDGQSLSRVSAVKRIVQSLQSNKTHQWKVIRNGRTLRVKVKPKETS